MAGPYLQVAGPNHVVQLDGIKLLGINAISARKLLFTVILFAFLYMLSKVLRWIAQKTGGKLEKTTFWTRQGVSIVIFLLAIIGFFSIWFVRTQARYPRPL